MANDKWCKFLNFAYNYALEHGHGDTAQEIYLAANELGCDWATDKSPEYSGFPPPSGSLMPPDRLWDPPKGSIEYVSDPGLGKKVKG